MLTQGLKAMLFPLCLGLVLGCGSGRSEQPDPGPGVPPPRLPEVKGNLHLRKVTGNLSVRGTASTPTYQAYFHIPIPFEEQAPFLLTLESPNLLEYRMVRTGPENLLVAAKLKAGPTRLQWEAHVLVKAQDLSRAPVQVPLSAFSQLPDSVMGWLLPSDSVQWTDPSILQKAQAVRGSLTDLGPLTDAVAAACRAIPGEFRHSPAAFDAFYALNWGNSCTGCAHAGAALLRANGVPARVLMNTPVTSTAYAYDHHWILQYWVPGYRWLRMETTVGVNRVAPETEIVTYVCAPEDEFQRFFPCGIDGHWHTSDPVLSCWDPDWNQAHAATSLGTATATPDEADQAVDLAAKVFQAEADRRGRAPGSEALLATANGFQRQALERLLVNDVVGFRSALQAALSAYGQVSLKAEAVRWREGFEGGGTGWTHGGNGDSWRVGNPVPDGRPTSAHSGGACLGNGFDGGYPLGSDSWALSPAFSLQGLGSATLSFWSYCWVASFGQGKVADPVWVELSLDEGQTFTPICSAFGGVNGDPAIPSVGGWARLHLDLTPWVGNASVRLRFRFQASSRRRLPGCYLDDLEVSGRPL